MDKLVRFSDYDVFAYIASGLAAFVVWDVTFQTNYVLGAHWSVASAALIIASAYIVGQILAAPSAWLIERQLAARILYRPTVALMNGKDLGWRVWLKRTLLQDYYSPLDAGLQGRIKQRVREDRGAELTGEGVFWCAFPVAKKDPNAYGRMDGFLKLYGFCRNMAFVGLAGAVLIAVDGFLEWGLSGWTPNVQLQLERALIAALLGVGMLHRYLKFFRLYAVEVLVAYSEWISAKEGHPEEASS